MNYFLSRLLTNLFKKHSLVFLLLSLLWGLHTSCRVLSKINTEKPLYAGGTLIVEGYDSIKLVQGVTYELEDQIYPKPNSKILGGRFGLSLFFRYEERKEKLKFIKKFLYDKFSEKPVYYDQEITKKVQSNIVDELYNNGYFNGTVNYELKKEKEGKLVYVTYTAYPNDHPYAINTFTFEGDSTLLQKKIKEELATSVLHTKPRYDLDQLEAEIARVTDSLQNNGYYYFRGNLLIYEADSALGNNTIDLFMKLKNNIPSKASQPYYIGEIKMNTDYQEDSSIVPRPVTEIDTLGYIYRGNPKQLKPWVLKDAILFKTGELYSQRKHRNTLKLLSSLGIFKYIDLAFLDTLKQGMPQTQEVLNVEGRMAQIIPKSISSEVGMTTWTNGYTGPEMKFSWQNRNFLGGAEIFAFSTEIGILNQFGNTQSSQVTSVLLLSMDLSLTFPRILFPFPVKLYTENALPSTKTSLSYETYWYRPIAQLRIVNGRLTYDWRPNFYKNYTLDLIDIIFQDSDVNTSINLDSIGDVPDFGVPIIENENIISSKYTYQYRSGKITEKKFVWAYSWYIDGAGNLIYGLQNAFGQNPTKENPGKFLGEVYAQYVRIGNDFRTYINLDRKFTLATRLEIDVGIPWGNATELPFIRSYFVGGPSSIRAFHPRTIGPGASYVAPGDNEYFEHEGDIKVLANLELRQSLSQYFKLAYFIDVGNVWLLNKNENFVNGNFEFSQFYKQLAIGTGVGFRLDLDFFVIRLDLGIPVLTPFKSLSSDEPTLNAPVKERLELREFPNKMIFNFAIGYPF